MADEALESILEEFSDECKQAVKLAEEEARNLGRDYLGTEHLLLGLCRVQTGRYREILQRLNEKPQKLRSIVLFIDGQKLRPLPEGHPFQGLTDRAKQVLRLAHDEAMLRQSNKVETEHLVIGLLREGEGIAAGAFESTGITLDVVRLTLDAMASHRK